MKRIFALLLTLMAFGAAMAPVAMAWTELQAAATLKAITRSKSACGQGYWVCGSYQQVELSRHNTLSPQWTGTALIYRDHPGSRTQACTVTAAINSNGTQHSAAVTCGVIQDN